MKKCKININKAQYKQRYPPEETEALDFFCHSEKNELNNTADICWL